MQGQYVFRVTVRLAPDEGYRVEPNHVETVLYREAAPPGEDGWLFFRDHCWRGELANPEHFRERAAAALGVPVADVSFSELHADPEYHAALREAIAADLAPFNAETVDEALTKYLGSSLRVEPVEDG